MALKKVLDKIDDLPDDVKKEYVEKDGKFVLQIDGDESESTIAHLTQKKTIAEEHRTKAENKAKELQDQLDEMRRGAIPKADLEALENSWKEKLDNATELTKTEKAKLQKQLDKVLRHDTAMRIATEISTVPDLLVPTIMSRLSIEETQDGDVRVRIKDKDGKLSALTLDELKGEIRSIEKYAPILIGSKGSGSGGNGNAGQNGNTPGGNEFAKMSESERVDFYKRDPDGYRKAAGLQT